jgi:hypothetical protein
MSAEHRTTGSRVPVQVTLLDLDHKYIVKSGEALSDASLSRHAYRNIALALVEDTKITIIRR